jgi:CRISPR type I-E-associated protein CasB/Cse2
VTQPAASYSSELVSELRSLRARYDMLPRGDMATLRRCRSADDVSLEGTYWRLVGTLGSRQVHLPHVVLLYPTAEHRRSERFAFGRFLARELGDSAGATLRFRRLLDSRERDELDHRLRGLLKLACTGGARVDWGVLGLDILWFFAESGAVRRRWAQDFYAPASFREPSHSPVPSPTPDR